MRGYPAAGLDITGVLADTASMAPLHLLAIFMPLVVALATIEGVWLQRVKGEDYDWRAWLASLGDFVGREAIYQMAPYGLAMPLVAWAAANRVHTVVLDEAWAFVGLFIGQEFFYYWFHRCAHRVRWYWATHAVHHSPNQLNLSAAYRFGWTGRLSGTTVFFVPLVWLGFPPGAVFMMLSLNLLYQFWLHATWIPKLGWLEYVLNTPSHHRVHHASNPEYIDANYGGVLIVFDRLFGTFVEERADLPCRYGLAKPLHSHNTVKIAFHEWMALARDLARARGPGDVLGYLLGPPGWRPGAPRKASGASEAGPGETPLAHPATPAKAQAD
jgi:sterol desaturase/sphingolipid hydroxylase (fatty acid hydroxylase superfamily)